MLPFWILYQVSHKNDSEKLTFNKLVIVECLSSHGVVEFVSALIAISCNS